MSFYGSVGWFNELPPPEQITDYSKYRDQSLNIPCIIEKAKEDKIEDKIEDEVVKEQPKKPLTYSF